MRRFAHLGAVVATTAALFPSLAAFNPAQAPSAPAEREGRDPLLVEEISPRAVDADSTVRIEGRVTNTTEDVLESVSVRMRYSGYPFSDRSQLGDFTSVDGAADERTPAYGPADELDDPLEPGEAAPFRIRVDAADLDLDGFGVYPVTVEALDSDAGSLASVRTFLSYEGPGGAPSPVEIAWVWPLMDYPRRTDDDTFLSTDLSASVGAQGRLGRLLTAGAQDDSLTLDPDDAGEDEEDAEETGDGQAPSPSSSADADADTEAEDAGDDDGDGGDEERIPVTWAVDPGLLSDIERLASGSSNVLEDTDVPGKGDTLPVRTVEADPGARVWLDQTADALQDAPLVATPYANPDVSALLGADLEDDLDAAVRLGDETLRRTLDRGADTSYALPPGGLIDAATLDYYTARGAESFLVSDTAMPARSRVEHTPTAAAPLPVEGGEDATGIVTDPGITEALGEPSRSPGEAALARQRFIAETAMISAEHTGEDRTVVAMPPTTWNPGEDFASGVLEDSRALPWLTPVELSDVEAPEGESERRGPAGGDATAEARLGQDHMDQVEEIRGTVRLFNSILVEDVDPYRPAVLRAESAAWRDEESRAARSVGLIGTSVRNGLGSVRIVPTEPVALASKTGTIGVIIANDLQGEDETVRIKLSMFSENPERLKVQDYTDEMEIGPGRKTTVYVPLEARINGRTMLYLSLQNTQGEPISSEESITPVNATGLGYQAIIISGIGALVLIAALTPRALRKWARRRAAAADGSPGPEDDGAEGESAGAEKEGGASDDRDGERNDGQDVVQEEQGPQEGPEKRTDEQDGQADAGASGSSDDAARTDGTRTDGEQDRKGDQ